LIDKTDGPWRGTQPLSREEASGAFFWLCAFFVVYCARPEDWIPGLNYLPLAKITGAFAFLALLGSLGKTQRKFKDLPREWFYLLAMVGVLFLSALFSPIWRGGALNSTIDFAKVCIAWVLTFLLVTNFKRLRRIIYIQAVSVIVITAVSIIKGHSEPRLEGVIGGIYSNPNDLAFAVVLTLPFCLAFLLTSKSILIRLCWSAGMLVMGLTLFMTASRAGFITLVISGMVVLWHFGVRGRRLSLIVISGFALVLLLAVAGGPLMKRLGAFTHRGDTQEEARAYESYEQRKFLVHKALEGIVRYPILGVGVRNFQVYSTVWANVHVTYLEIAVEGGIPALVLYLLFFARAFSNLKKLRGRKDLDVHTVLFIGGLHSSMIGFVIGASFAPEAYQYFPYFSVAYTSALVATIAEIEYGTVHAGDGTGARRRFEGLRVNDRKPDAVRLAP
jgi:O-antigen ligase